MSRNRKKESIRKKEERKRRFRKIRKKEKRIRKTRKNKKRGIYEKNGRTTKI